ncbi:U3 small nucleolar RNA-associated protein 4 homolog [Aethina tumida]|uniref:U3 small nucleolar RNA-associated protein 4 homolog n=1 Tax=Aethina tumida TaxID=116153 RepID=UPI00096B1C3E|nr:U3 small nucleolar RNA-associated protein 4 homolog [Aethina tumida]
MSLCKIHNVRFYKPKTRSIYNIALRKPKKKLAVARSDATIEIWDVNNSAVIEKTIYPTIEFNLVEGLAWCNDRLFSVNLHGFLIEYDLYKLCVKQAVSVTGGAAYCIDANQKKQIAVGTEQGFVNIYNLEEELIFDCVFDKQEGRIISIKFDKTGDFIVTGSIDAIRIWEVLTGHALHKLSPGRSEVNKPTIVWCLEVVNDFTVISGDSRGKLTFWDGKVGAQIESYQSHKADLLAICVSDDEKSLYCAGADPCISNYVQVSVKDGTKKWVRSIQRRIHEHDVRALVLVHQKLYSGGIDGYLACSFHPPKTLLRSPPVMQNRCTDITESRHILLRYPTHLEVWKLGEGDAVERDYKGIVPVVSEPKKLLVLQRTVKNSDGEKDQEGICASCISNNGKWVMFSTCSGTTLVIFQEDNKPALRKVQLENANVQCNKAIFTKDSSQLILAPCEGGLAVYTMGEDSVSLSQEITFASSEISDSVTHLISSDCGKYLVVGDASSNIVILHHYKTDGWRTHCKLPKYSESVTAIGLHSSLQNIVVSYSDNKIVEFDYKKRLFTQFSRELHTKPLKRWTTWSYPIRNITFDPKNDNIIILHDDTNIIILNKDQKVENELDAKVPKLDSSKFRESFQNGVYVINKYKHLVNLDWLSKDELVAVEINPLHIFEQLPPAFERKTFGTK